MTLYTESVADQTIHFADAFVCEKLHASMTLWRRYVFRKFDADAILFRGFQYEKRDILMFKRRFQCG